MLGYLDEDTAHPDSGKASIEDIVLTREWQRHRVDQKKLDLSSIKVGFYIAVTGRASSVTVYLDQIRFVR